MTGGRTFAGVAGAAVGPRALLARGGLVAALLARGGLVAALLAFGGCSRGPRPGPETRVADTAAGVASLADRRAWAAAQVGRTDVAPARLEELARRGFFAARLCPGEAAGWTLDPGPPLEGYRVVWSCPQCRPTAGPDTAAGLERATGPGTAAGPERAAGPGTPDGAAAAGRGAPADAPARPRVPPDEELPWPVKTSPGEEVAAEVEDVLARWAEAGHPLGRVQPSARVDGALLGVSLTAHPGPHVRLSGLRFEGNRVTRRGYLLRLLAWRGEEAYRHSRWTAARAALLGSGLFDDVEGPLLVRPPGVDPRADSLRVDLLYRLRERRVSSFAGLVGYSGQSGNVSGFVNLELGNLFGTGRRTRVLWRAQRERESRFELAWREPYVWRLPLSADLELTHVLEDTLYAETSWGLQLGMPAGVGWTVRAGWSWRRLVLGGATEEDRRRQTARFGVGRHDAFAGRATRGWELELDLAGTRDAGERLHHAEARVRGWVSGRGLMLLIEEQAGLVAGADSVLRGDALSVGGASSLRGYFETAYRATRCLVQRAELGPAASPAGTRLYVLLDVGWLREWRPGPAGVFGAGAGDVFRWAAGLGLQAPARAGDLRLDYAVPGGEPVWKGRIHFGLISRF